MSSVSHESNISMGSVGFFNKAPEKTGINPLGKTNLKTDIFSELDLLKHLTDTDESELSASKKIIFKQVKESPIDSNTAKDIYVASKVATNGFFSGATEDVYGSESNLRTHNSDDLPSALIKNLNSDNKTIHIGAIRARVTENLRDNEIYVNFSGLTPKTLATDVKFIFKNLFCCETKEMKKALDIVDQVMAKNPDKKLIITGHSMGGALASYCGIKRQCRVVNFNGMGLRHKLLNKMAEEVSKSEIIHVNTKGDWLSQCVQRGILSQPGQRYHLDNFSGHGLHYEKSGQHYLLPDALRNKRRL